MYRVGKRSRHLRSVKLATYGLLVLIILSGVFVYFDTRDTTFISRKTTPKIIKKITAPDAVSQTIQEPLFKISLPAGWHEIAHQTRNVTYITWDRVNDQVARTLTVYVDTIPTTMPVNRVLPVSPNGDGLVLGTISENCTNFAIPSKGKDIAVEARWQRVNFMCDIPNSLRNVVGTGSQEGINTVTLTGATGGAHKYFFVYTDNSANPDDSVFIHILQSFRVK